MAIINEQLTSEDESKIRKGAKNNIAIFFVLFVVLFATYQLGVKGLGNELSRDAQINISAVIVVLGFVGVSALIFRNRFVRGDLKERIKEIYIGPIKKKIKILRKVKSIKYLFCIDDKNFGVTKTVYGQHQDGDVLRIERAPKSGYILNIRVANQQEMKIF